MAWWLWILLGFGLLLCEVLTPGGFFFLFFGLGAIAVGGFAWLGLGEPAWVEWLLFSVVSLAFMLPLRSRLVRWSLGSSEKAVDTLVGQTAVVLDELPLGGVGKVELRGTSWTARNADSRALTRGELGTVTRVDGLTLWVRAEGGGGGTS